MPTMPALPYQVYFPTKQTRRLFHPDKPTTVLSVDIGVQNFAVRVETWDPEDNVVTPEIFDLRCFSKSKLQGQQLSGEVLVAANEFLHMLRPHWERADLIVIERQLFIAPRNRQMFDLVLNYFLSRTDELAEGCIVLDVDPKLKSRQLCDKKLEAKELKRWSVDFALSLLKERGDEESIAVLQTQLQTSKKADDLADTIVQVEALKRFEDR